MSHARRGAGGRAGGFKVHWPTRRELGADDADGDPTPVRVEWGRVNGYAAWLYIWRSRPRASDSVPVPVLGLWIALRIV